MTQSFEFQSALAAARNGDARALDSLFDRFYPQVKRMVHRSLTADLRDKRPWLVSAFSTGDVVQEVFRHVVRDFDSFAGTSEAAFVSYLATLIKNRLVDAIRFHEAVRRDRRRLRPAVDGRDVESGTRQPAERLAAVEDLERFCGVLLSFPTRERTLLRTRLETGGTFAELADSCGYPSADAARKAFYTAQSRLLLRLRAAGVSSQDQEP